MEQLYIVTGGIGFFYIVVTTLMGHIGDDEGVDADAPDGADGGDAPDGGDAGDAPDGGADDGGDAPDGGDGHHNRFGSKVANAAQVGPHARSTGLFFAIVKILSPLRIALILFLFGVSGILLSRMMPFLGDLNAVPAALCAFFFSNVLFTLLGRMVRKMEKTDSFRKEDAIGSVGQLSVPITAGATGEITFTLRGSRTHAPAKAISKDGEISKSSKVIISDLKDGVYYVEPFSD